MGRGIGAILQQQDEEGTWRPCAYWSRALTKAERRYSATELECSGLHNTILHWKNYLRNGHKFEVIVDHYALVYMVTKMGSEQQNQRLLRLCLDLQGFDFTVTHQSGTKHLGADAVSRLLQTDEEPWVRDEDDLRDDWGPLTEHEKSLIERQWHVDAKFMIDTINEHREKKRLEDEEEERRIERELQDRSRETKIVQQPVAQGMDLQQLVDAANRIAFEGDQSGEDSTGERLMCGKCDSPVSVARSTEHNTTAEERELEKQMEGEVRQFRMICQSRSCGDWRQKGTCYTEGSRPGGSRSAEPSRPRGRESDIARQRRLSREKAERLRNREDLFANWHYVPNDEDERERRERQAARTWTARDEKSYHEVNGPWIRRSESIQCGTWSVEKQRDFDECVKHNGINGKPNNPFVQAAYGRDVLGIVPERRKAELKASYEAKFGPCVVDEQSGRAVEKLVEAGLEHLRTTGTRDLRQSECMRGPREDPKCEARRQRKATVAEQLPPRPATGFGRATAALIKKQDGAVKGIAEQKPTSSRGRRPAEYSADGHSRGEKGDMVKIARPTAIDEPAGTGAWGMDPVGGLYQMKKVVASDRDGASVSWEREYQESSQEFNDKAPVAALDKTKAARDIARELQDCYRHSTEAHDKIVGLPITELINNVRVIRQLGDKWNYALFNRALRRLARLDDDAAERAVETREQLWKLESEQSKLEKEYQKLQLGDEAQMQEDLWWLIKAQQKCIDKFFRERAGWLGEDGAARPNPATERNLKTGAFKNSNCENQFTSQRYLMQNSEWEDMAVEPDLRWYQQLAEETIDYHVKGLAEMKTESLRAAVLSRSLVKKMKELIRDELSKRESQRNVITQMSNQRLAWMLHQPGGHAEYNAYNDRVDELEDEVLQRALRADYDRASRVWRTQVDGHVGERTAVSRRAFNAQYLEGIRDGSDPMVEFRKAEQLIMTARSARQAKTEPSTCVKVNTVTLREASVHDVLVHNQSQSQATSQSQTQSSRIDRPRTDAILPDDVKERIAKIEEDVRQERKEWDITKRYVDDQTKRTKALRDKAEQHTAKIAALRAKQDEWRKKGATRGYKNPEAETEASERVLKRLISQFNHLLMQHYTDPATDQVYQIYDTRMIVRDGQKHFVAVARPVCSREEDSDGKNIQYRTIHGEDGAADLVNRYTNGMRLFNDNRLPSTDEEWLAEQRLDPVLVEIIERLEQSVNGIIPLDRRTAEESRDFYYMPLNEDQTERGALRRRVHKTRENAHNDVTVKVTQSYSQIVVPVQRRRQILYVLHDCMGHPGRSRTTETIKTRFHWATIYGDIKHYIANCRYCQLRKANNRVAKVPVMIYNYSERPNSRVHMDLAGPFQLTHRGSNHYVMVIKCALTKWVVMIPLRDKSMLTVQREYLNNWVGHFGAPTMLITDRGTEFHNVVAEELAQIWGCRKVETTPRNPRSDGLAENQMRSMKDMLASYIQENQRDWDEHLHLVAQAYNNTVNDATGFTPYFLVHGTEMTSPSEGHLESLRVNEFQELTRRTKDVMQWCWSFVGRQVVKNSEHHNKTPVERLTFKPFQKGDFFYLRVVPKAVYRDKSEEEALKISAKLQFRYTGPYLVQKVISPILYQAMVHGEVKTVHALNMKPAARDKNSVAIDRTSRDVE